MKIGFFFFAFGLTVLMAFYVTLRGWQALAPFGNAKMWYMAINIVMFLSMIVSMIYAASLPQVIAKPLSQLGFSYMIPMIYFLLAFLLIDLVRIANFFFHFAPAGMMMFRFFAFIASLAAIIVVMIVGSYRFNHPEIVRLNITAEKPLQHKHIRIVAASDIHLGVTIDKNMLKKYVEMINAQKPDLVLLAGDVTDRSVKPVIAQHMNEELSQIHAPMGVFAISGNHEYYSENPLATSEYIKTAGIVTLRDSVALVNQSVYVVGRDDRTNPHRKSVAEIMKSVDASKPVILLDHQPNHLEEAEQNHVDLQISGHTHNGQFFPGNLLVKNMYEVPFGFKKKGSTNYYVSSGLGIWGPQYRIGTQSELIIIDFNY